MADASTVSTESVGEVLRFRAAYEQLKDEIAAVPDDQLAYINVDIPSAVTTVLGAMGEIRALRARLVEELPKFDMARFDKLELYALAAGHAHTLFMAASMPTESLPALSEECAALRDLFRSDAEALVRRRLLDGSRLKDLKGTTGYRDIAFDVFTLAQILRENWAKISGKTALQPVELNHAESLADRLATAVGVRDQTPAVVGDASENRHRAFTLLIKTYRDVQRAVAYLEPSSLDEIAPTVHVTRGPSRKRGEEAEPAEEAVPAVATQPVQAAAGPAVTKVPNDSPYTA